MKKVRMKKFLMFGIFVMFLLKVQGQQYPSDCANAVIVCGNGNFSSNAEGAGEIDEVAACGSIEHNTIWLKIDIVQAGNLGFDLIPDDADLAVDYDFWVYDASTGSCGDLWGNALRCNTINPLEAGLPSNNTGINGSTTAVAQGPGAMGDSAYVYWLNVSVGDSYYIVIDRPYDGGGFEIQWTGSAMEGDGAFPEAPVANEIDDLMTCSSNGATGIFNLNAVKSDINADLTNNTIEFYASLADATDGIDPLPGIYTNTSNPQQIYAKVENVAGCYDLVEFNLLVSEIPEVTVVADNTEVCNGEDVTFTFTGTPGATVGYSINDGTTQQILLDDTGAATLTQSFTEDTVFEVKYARIIDSVGDVICSQTLSDIIDITVNGSTAPTVSNNSPICEGDIGVITFSGEPNATIDYHINSGSTMTLTLDASGNYTLQFPDLLTTTEVTIESATSAVAPFCSLDINAVETLVVETILTLEEEYVVAECDTDGDGQYTFNLLDYESQFLANATDPSNYQVAYYPSQQDAVDDTNEITNPSAYTTSPNPQTVLGIRVSTGGSNCSNTAVLVLELTVLPDPSTTALDPIVLCDLQTPNDSQEPFDLTQYEATIANGIANLNFTYHTSQAEAESGANPIPDPSNYVSGTSTVYVNVTSANAGTTTCYAVFNFDLEVQPVPTIAMDSMTVCSADGSGFYAFDLLAETDNILGAGQSAADYTLRFYEDAAGNNPITANPYTNTTAFNQTIYVLIASSASGCSETFPFELNVEAAAIANMPEPMTVCDYDGENDGYAALDLTSLNAEVLNGQSPTDFSVSYYLSQSDAANGTNAIADPAAYINGTAYGETIYIRVVNNNIPDECFDTTSFEYTVAPLLNPEIYSQDGGDTICVDYQTGEVLNAVTLVSDLQDPNYAYTWYLNGVAIAGATQGTYTVNTASPGLYTVSIEEIQSETNCTSEISQAFEVFQSSQAVLVSVNQSGAFSANPSIIVEVEGYGEYWYQLDDGPIVDNGGVFTNVSGGLHTVYVYDMKTETSCGELVIENIRIIDYPKVFTPNGDGHNDFWNIFALQDHREAEILIFDRYGKILTKIRPAGMPWDGSFNGKPLPSTDYWFVLTYEELGVPKKFQAHFSIKR